MPLQTITRGPSVLLLRQARNRVPSCATMSNSSCIYLGCHEWLASPTRPFLARCSREAPICDTSVALADAAADGSVILGKNSDRETD